MRFKTTEVYGAQSVADVWCGCGVGRTGETVGRQTDGQIDNERQSTNQGEKSSMLENHHAT